MDQLNASNPIQRRQFVKRAAYTAPVIVTLAVAPSFAKAGSVKRGRGHEDDGPGNSPGNGPVTGPGNGYGPRRP